MVARQDLATAYESTAVIGPAFWPRSIQSKGSPLAREQLLHEFDLSNLYTISRFWEVGSCPHLFARVNDGGSLQYLGELFAGATLRPQSERVAVPDGIGALLIVELQRERTTIEELRINGLHHISQVCLEQGDVVWLSVRPGDIVELRGYYSAEHSALPDPWLRNSVISDFMMCATQHGAPSVAGTASTACLVISA